MDAGVLVVFNGGVFPRLSARQRDVRGKGCDSAVYWGLCSSCRYQSRTGGGRPVSQSSLKPYFGGYRALQRLGK